MSVAKWKGPRPSDPSLLILAEVAYCTAGGRDGGMGAPECGMRTRTVDSCEAAGLVERWTHPDVDVDSGPRRLRLTDLGRLALEVHGADHRRWMAERFLGRRAS